MSTLQRVLEHKAVKYHPAKSHEEIRINTNDYVQRRHINLEKVKPEISCASGEVKSPINYINLMTSDEFDEWVDPMKMIGSLED